MHPQCSRSMNANVQQLHTQLRTRISWHYYLQQIKASHDSSKYFLSDPIPHKSQTMRFSAMARLVVVTALASSICAMPIDTDTDKCPGFCTSDAECNICGLNSCVSFSGLCFEFDKWLTGTEVLFYLLMMQVFEGVSKSLVWSNSKFIQSS